MLGLSRKTSASGSRPAGAIRRQQNRQMTARRTPVILQGEVLGPPIMASLPSTPSSPSPGPPVAAARPKLSSDLREMLGELLEYRELLFSMARRDFLLRYKQTVMGI